MASALPSRLLLLRRITPPPLAWPPPLSPPLLLLYNLIVLPLLLHFSLPLPPRPLGPRAHYLPLRRPPPHQALHLPCRLPHLPTPLDIWSLPPLLRHPLLPLLLHRLPLLPVLFPRLRPLLPFHPPLPIISRTPPCLVQQPQVGHCTSSGGATQATGIPFGVCHSWWRLAIGGRQLWV